MLAAFLTTILFSLSVLFASRTTRVLGGIRANFYRLCISTVLLAIWAHAFGHGFGGGAFGLFFLSGCIGFGAGDIALYQAIPRLGPRLAILMVQCGAAPVGALTEWIWMGTTLTLAQAVSGLIILAGVAIALAPGEHLHIPPRTLFRGVLLGVVAALGQGVGAVVSRKAFAVSEAAGHEVNSLAFGLTSAYQRILGGLLLGAITFFWLASMRSRRTGGADPGPRPRRDARRLWAWITLNSLAGPVLGVGCYQWALATTKTGVVLPIVATTPLVVIPFAYLMEGERPGPRSLLGGVIAVGGVVGLTLSQQSS